MQVLVIDSTSQGQLETSQRILELPESDLDLLNLRIKLAGPDNYQEFIANAAVAIIGPGLCEQFNSLAISIMAHNPHVAVLIFANNQCYSREYVGVVQRTGVRKAIAPDATALDLLQEFLAISTEQLGSGRGRIGKIFAFSSAKGGAGVTTLVAGLGELCAEKQLSTLLWDFDNDSKDLCRALSIPANAGDQLNSWVVQNHSPSRDEFESALFKAHDRVAVMPTPSGIGEALDLCYHSDCQALLKRMLELSRCLFDVTLIDIGGANGASLKTILSNADEVILLTGECPLSVTACDFYLNKIIHATGNLDRVRFLVAGSRYTPESIKDEIQQIFHLNEKAWDLPAIHNDPAVCNWPGTGRTMYSLGNQDTKLRLQQLASKLGILAVEDTKIKTNLRHLNFQYQKSRNVPAIVFSPKQSLIKSGVFHSLGLLKRA